MGNDTTGGTRVTFDVHYQCHKCGADFVVSQYAPGRDEDITLCWDCTGRLFGR